MSFLVNGTSITGRVDAADLFLDLGELVTLHFKLLVVLLLHFVKFISIAISVVLGLVSVLLVVRESRVSLCMVLGRTL